MATATTTATEVMIPASELIKLMYKAIEFPFGQICKHLVACDLAETLADHGVVLSEELLEAVACADDRTSLGLLASTYEGMAGESMLIGAEEASAC